MYSVDGPDHSRLRVVFNEHQTEVLERMKGIHRAHGQDRERVLKDPESVFEGLLEFVNVRYGRRVIGIGAIQIATQGAVNRGRSVLDSGFTERGSRDKAETIQAITITGECVTVSLESTTSKLDFVAAVSHAVRNDKSTFEFAGHTLALDDTATLTRVSDADVIS